MSSEDFYPLDDACSQDAPRPDPPAISNSIVPFILQGLRRQKRRELIKELIREVAHDANFDLTEFVTKDDVENVVKEVLEDTRRTENFLTMSDLEHYVDHDLDLSDFVKLDELAEKIEEELGNNDIIQKAAEGAVRAAIAEKWKWELQITELQSAIAAHTITIRNLVLMEKQLQTFGGRVKWLFLGRV